MHFQGSVEKYFIYILLTHIIFSQILLVEWFYIRQVQKGYAILEHKEIRSYIKKKILKKRAYIFDTKSSPDCHILMPMNKAVEKIQDII